MQIFVDIDDETIKTAAELTAAYSTDILFIEKIAKIKHFNHTPLTPLEISKVLYEQAHNVKIYLKGYKTWNPWSRVIGYAKGNTIYINLRKLDTIDLYERVENLYHEYCHLAGFTHRGNRVTRYNLETVPYKAGKLFSEHVKSSIKR